MKNPLMTNLNSEQRKELIISAKQSMPNYNYKEIAVEALDFYDKLLDELKSPKISTKRLQQLVRYK